MAPMVNHGKQYAHQTGQALARVSGVAAGDGSVGGSGGVTLRVLMEMAAEPVT